MLGRARRSLRVGLPGRTDLDEARLELIHREERPLVDERTLVAPESRNQSRLPMLVSEMEADRRRLEHEAAFFLNHWYSPERVAE